MNIPNKEYGCKKINLNDYDVLKLDEFEYLKKLSTDVQNIKDFTIIDDLKNSQVDLLVAIFTLDSNDKLLSPIEDLVQQFNISLNKQIIFHEHNSFGIRPITCIGSARAIAFLDKSGIDIGEALPHSKFNILKNMLMSHRKDLLKSVLNREGFDINVRDEYNDTLLHITAKDHKDSKIASRNLIMVAGVLIDKGIDINAKNNSQETALDIAIKRNQPQMVRFLKEEILKQTSTISTTATWRNKINHNQSIKIETSKSNFVRN